VKTALVNFADRTSWYQDGQARLVRSLHQHGLEFEPLLYKSFSELQCPEHTKVPYAFKVYAIQRAKLLGYDVVFYGDASIYAVRSVKPIIDHVTRHGYYLEATEHNLGTWSSDAALAKLGIDRETAFSIPTIVAGCVAFDFRQPIASQILDRWFETANDGVTFPGSWNNTQGEVSSDPRVRGHRHDQTALSGIAHHLQLKLLPFETYIFYATPPPPQAVFHCHPTI
jgi:hypothetical protein